MRLDDESLRTHGAYKSDKLFLQNGEYSMLTKQEVLGTLKDEGLIINRIAGKYIAVELSEDNESVLQDVVPVLQTAIIKIGIVKTGDAFTSDAEVSHAIECLGYATEGGDIVSD